MKIGKDGKVFNEVMIQIILVVVIFSFFLIAIADKSESRGIKRQVLEKQTALLIDSARPGMEFEIRRVNLNGIVNNVKVEDGRIFISVEGLTSIKGYPYFSLYDVGVEALEDKFVVRIS